MKEGLGGDGYMKLEIMYGMRWMKVCQKRVEKTFNEQLMANSHK